MNAADHQVESEKILDVQCRPVHEPFAGPLARCPTFAHVSRLIAATTDTNGRPTATRCGTWAAEIWRDAAASALLGRSGVGTRTALHHVEARRITLKQSPGAVIAENHPAESKK
jgi:hypothetical protein